MNSEQDDDLDSEKFDLPVTRAELWDLLLGIDMLTFLARSIAVAAANGDTESIARLKDEYDKRDNAFTIARDNLIALKPKKVPQL